MQGSRSSDRDVMRCSIQVVRRLSEQPLQMLWSFRSIAFSSSSIVISPLVRGPVAAVPPPAALLPAEPVVIDDPGEFAVPRLLVPGGGCETTLPALPAEAITEILVITICPVMM